MKIALITDTHFGARNDNLFFNDYFYKFWDNVFFPYVKDNGIEYKLSIFGKHNLYNLEAGRNICKELGIKNNFFFQTIISFLGAKKRLELFKIINS